MDRWAHQPREVTHALDPARALFWSPRGGKTRPIVECMEIQRDVAGARRMLVIAPQLVCQDVWTREIAERNVGSIADLSHGKIVDRKEALRQLRYDSTGTMVVLVNWDSLSRLIEDIIKWKPDVVIADEAHLAKSAGAARSRALHRLGRVARFRRALTGTPTPKNYLDLYSQFKFLDSTIFGTNKAGFVERYVELDFYGRPKYYKKFPELREKMLSITSVFDRKTEWKDLPPQEIRRKVTLPPEARKLYDQIVRNTVAEWDGMEIDATHKLARTAKLQQLTAGFMRDDDGNVHWIHTAKIDAVLSELDDLLDSGEKVLVFYHYAEEGRRLEQAIRSMYDAVVGRIGGDTNLITRKNLKDQFKDEKSALKVMVVQDSLGIGIELKADYLLRTSYPLDYAAYDQSNERMYKGPDQNRTWITIEVPNSVDQTARRICVKKEQSSRALTGNSFEDVAYGRLDLEMAA